MVADPIAVALARRMRTDQRDKAALRRLRAVDARENAELVPTRVEARNDDGTLQVRPLGGECVARAPGSSLYVGQEFLVPPTAPFPMTGAAGMASQSSSRETATMRVTSLVPSLYLPGASYTVRVGGYGFTAVSAFEFLRPGTRVVNDDIAVLETRFLSETECEMDLEIDPEAAPITANTGDLAYDNPGMPLL